MKKHTYIHAVLGAALIFSVTACGDSGGDPTGSTSNDTPAATDPSAGTTDEPTGGTISGTGNESGSETAATTAATDTATDTGMVNPECGNNVVEGTEQCDDGNQVDGDGCEANCVNTAVCGNGTVEVGEVCDDNNTMDGDMCSADCLTETVEAVCGNGKQEGREQERQLHSGLGRWRVQGRVQGLKPQNFTMAHETCLQRPPRHRISRRQGGPGLAAHGALSGHRQQA